VDDRRVITGIIVALRSGGRQIDVPAEYEPGKTLYNRSVRWSARGVWQNLLQVLAAVGGPPIEVALDSTLVKAHRCAVGGKGVFAPRLSGRRTRASPESDGFEDSVPFSK